MRVIKAKFDGKTIKLPKQLKQIAPGEVLIIFDSAPAANGDRSSWLKAQELAFAKVWDNDEDAIYDTL
jgi:TusA-related sulfurtransferase